MSTGYKAIFDVGGFKKEERLPTLSNGEPQFRVRMAIPQPLYPCTKEYLEKPHLQGIPILDFVIKDVAYAYKNIIDTVYYVLDQ